MRQKLRLLTHIVVLFSLSAFLIKPMLVTFENSAQLLKTAPIQKSIDDPQASLLGDQANLRLVVRENPQFSSPMPCFTRVILPSLVIRVVAIDPEVVSVSPRSPLILRI